ncbi:MAG: hypothetical protein RSD93_00050, partial [Gordonibacter sp.]
CSMRRQEIVIGWTALVSEKEGVIMADEDRRPGDWQRKDLRQRADDEVDEYNASNSNGKKWHQQTFWIIFFLVVFWPVGIVLCWRSDWHVAFKIVASVLVAVAVCASYNMYLTVQQLQLAG